MTISQIVIALIDPNPFQTRKSYDPEILEGLKRTAQNGLGIRFMPIVRPHPEANGRYQIASGHSRVEAWKQLGNKKIQCRVELLDDRQMAREMLVENLHRQKMSDEEIYEALEIIRELYDIPLESKPGRDGYGYQQELNKITGIPINTISKHYTRHEVRSISILGDKLKPSIIDSTAGLNKEERIPIVEKATEQDWTAKQTREVKEALKEVEEPEKRREILQDLTREKKISAEDAVEAIKLRKDADLPVIDIKRVNPADTFIRELEDISFKLANWGTQKQILLGDRVGEALDLLKTIERHIQHLMEVFRQ